MMVPRAFKHGVSASSPAPNDHEERERKPLHNPLASPRTFTLASEVKRATHQRAMAPRPAHQKRNPTASVLSPSKPVEIPERTRPSKKQQDVDPTPNTPPTRSCRQNSTASTATCSESMPASVAALLAMTVIPPRKTDRPRRRKTTGVTNISIDELVKHWKSDDTLRSSLSSSPSMSILLEDAYISHSEGMGGRKRNDTAGPSVTRMSRTRSVSTDSVPSLEGDGASVQSVRAPSTPGSLRSRHSLSYFKRDKAKSASLGEDCLFDHPLILPPSLDSALDNLHDELETSRSITSKTRSSFRSNLTTSLQALKAAAINSISSLTSSNATTALTRPSANSSHIDDALWSHPFLFPRLSSEMRPTIQGTPTKAQRRYLNPMPLTFEEQEAPFQKALHAPFLAEALTDAAPLIQLQPYMRNRRRSTGKSRGATPDSQSEAGRAQLLTSGIRQREPRENADFLRVVVLEMNMRRAGKLDTGRARIWLPPRQVSERPDEAKDSGKVPVRWQSMNA